MKTKTKNITIAILFGIPAFLLFPSCSLFVIFAIIAGHRFPAIRTQAMKDRDLEKVAEDIESTLDI